MNLAPETVDAVLRFVPHAVKEILMHNRVTLAGGAIRETVTGGAVKDIDIFCHSEAEALRLASTLGPVARSLNAYNVTADGLPVQFVFFRDYTDAEDLISQFDFRACCAAVYWDVFQGWRGIAVDGFEQDCKRRVLTFLRQPKDAGSLVPLQRALRLAEKGWHLPAKQTEAILTHWDATIAAEHVRRSLKPSYGGGK